MGPEVSRWAAQVVAGRYQAGVQSSMHGGLAAKVIASLEDPAVIKQIIERGNRRSGRTHWRAAIRKASARSRMDALASRLRRGSASGGVACLGRARGLRLFLVVGLAGPEHVIGNFLVAVLAQFQHLFE